MSETGVDFLRVSTVNDIMDLRTRPAINPVNSLGTPRSSVEALDAWGRRESARVHSHNSSGEFSMTVVQANNLLEDQSQIESDPLTSLESSGPYGTFVGIYDGHGGPETTYYINDHLFQKYIFGDQRRRGEDITYCLKIQLIAGEDIACFPAMSPLTKTKLK
ncbi:hypothetical protein NE237_026678 [Protea cynaroides]|uniref:Uncharacterized protein n=1 Tax=Protea cynaroides TaxID=273540 RepID=A0A9Q0K1Q2_9MAGN|nr:hypothetical protein NE237_026678 [Protea cynaroides]